MDSTHADTAVDSASPSPAELDVERFRVKLERDVAAILERAPVFDLYARSYTPSSGETLRRELLAAGLRLTESMAPELHRAASLASSRLGVTTPCEIYQSAAARENAAIHLIESPVMLEVQGRLLANLDEGTRLAVLGHEFGHYVAHGPWTHMGRVHSAARQMAQLPDADPGLRRAASTLSMAAELTADRFGLLACRDLRAALRLEMMLVTGLSDDALTWDTSAYLAQVRELVEGALASGDEVRGVTHPEHGVRAYALALFAETDEYRRHTGEGPGSRTLAEVDAILERFFARKDLDLEFDVLDAPPPELHECALAGAVLVALADGEVVEDETLALERIFANVIPDFRDVLEHEAALERFYLTGGIVSAYGPSTLRALFQLLVHVMVADGKVDPRESAMILAIGRALGCDGMFDPWLAATLRGLGVPPDSHPAPTAELPLPPRTSETKTALDAFFDGAARRGGSETNLRRLLRLLGAAQPTADVLARISSAAADAGLRLDRELDPSRLDHRIVFESIAPVRASISQGPAPTADRKALMRAITRLRDELVSGDGRSPSVRVRESRRGRVFDLAALERVSSGLAERVLAQLRDGKSAALVTAAEVGRHDGAKKVADDLLELDRTHRGELEETGADDLYLGYPVLTGVAAGYYYRAPLVLHSVDLVPDARGARGFTLIPREDEPPIVNQSLVRLIFHKKGFALPEALRETLDDLAADETKGPEAVLHELASLGLGSVKLRGVLGPLRNRDEEMALKRDHCEVEECALLGLFPQSGSDLLQDYDALLDDLAAPDADLSRLLGAAEELLPSHLRTEGRFPSAARSSDEPPARPALHADPSQRDVLQIAREIPVLVVDGPPGTGKSQVIVNLIVDALARGERIAVVCEKRAALDVVVQRIEQIGLREALGVVHDVHVDRKSLYAQIATRLETPPGAAFDDARRHAVDAEAHAIETTLAERAALRAKEVPGTRLSVGRLQTLVSGIRAPDLSGRFGLETVDDSLRKRLEDALVSLEPFADLVRAGGPLEGPAGAPRRASTASFDARRIDATLAGLTRAVELARAYERLAATSPASIRDLGRADEVLRTVVLDRSERRDLEGRGLFVDLLRTRDEPSARASIGNAANEWTRRRADVLAVSTPVDFEPDAALEANVNTMLAWTGRFTRFFVFAWWSARSAVRAAMPTHFRDQLGRPLAAEALGTFAAKLSASRAWAALRTALAAIEPDRIVPADASTADSLVTRIRALAAAAATVVDHRTALEAIGAYPASSTRQAVELWDDVVDARIAQRDAAEALSAAVAEVATVFPWIRPEPTSDELEQLRGAYTRDASRLVAVDAILDRARECHPGVDALFGEVFRSVGEDRPLARPTLVRAWALDALLAAERADPRVGRLAEPTPLGPEPELGRRLAELERARSGLLAEWVRASLDGNELMRAGQAAPRARRTAAQSVREAMLKETKKQRRIMPLRGFVRRYAASGLLDVVPVWLLSPETMTILFPREPLFDRVIFDEASQCTVESGFPVLVRARSAVIAGDDKQMPPTSFFASKTHDDEVDEKEEVREQRDLLAEESLLTLAASRVPRRRLSWHYRCRHESLIAFSNHAMYEGQLLTIPSTAGPRATPALRWHPVADAVYDEGRNRIEAEAVVDVAAELLGRETPPSLGIVTFNLQQRAAVLEAIDGRRSTDPGFGALWDARVTHEQLDQRPFVKNLESVQGDERDVIVFSLGHAPVDRRRRDGSTERYVPARFGPLGLRGGERRLNVAVSRAKEECIVVSSFEPPALTVASSRHAGPVLFKQFLEYVNHLSNGRRSHAERILAIAGDRHGAKPSRTYAPPLAGYIPLATQIALALERLGVSVELDVGSSAFRIPLAVVDPTDATRLRLAILTDEGDELPTPFEQFVHRPFVLEQRGFEVLRVTAATWMHARGNVLDTILARIHRS